MKVEYLFSSNKKIGSKVISWAASFEKTGLERNPSHIAVLLDGEIVVESTLFTGVRMIPYTKWLEINEELYRIPCGIKDRPSQATLEKVTHLWGRSYDWGGILFFAWRMLGLILLNRPLPKINRWQNKNKYFCTEYAGSLTGIDMSMKSPAALCAEWIK